MQSDSPTPEIQRELIEAEIKVNQQQYWLMSLRAKSFKKAGIDDLAKANAETAAKLEAYVEVLKAELKAIE